MAKDRLLRIGVAVCAIAATLALSMLPPEHLHASDADGAVVHRHVADHESDHHGLEVDGDEHHADSILELTYVREREFDVDRPLIIGLLVLAAPERPLLGRVAAVDAPRDHGPPTRVVSLRAPPA